MILAQHEKQLTVNLFDKNEKSIDCELYDCKNNIIVNYYKNKLTFLKKDLKEIGSFEVPTIKKLLLSPDGKLCGILSFAKELLLFTKESKVYERKNVFNFCLSETHLVVQEGNSIKIIENKNFSEIETFQDINFYSLMGDTVLLWKNKENEIIIFKERIIFREGFEEVSKVECKGDGKGNILLLITSKYVSNNYYGHDTLYFFNKSELSLKKINVEYPPLFYEFKDENILICSGYQPSQAYLFDYNLRTIKQFKKGIRNRMYINNHNNLVAFCGFDSLSGNIEVYNIESSELLTKFKVKGASLFDWSPNGSFFIVSTTNYMKVDNGVILYDYFGRFVEQRKFDSLVKSEWIGEKEDFIEQKRPEKLLIEQENVYKLPKFDFDEKDLSRKNGRLKKNSVSKITTKENNQKVSVKKEKSLYDLKKELQFLEKIKEKREKGEDLSVNELNLLLKEGQLINEIQKYEEK